MILSSTASFGAGSRSEEHTSELQSHHDLVCRLLLEKKKKDEFQAPPTQHASQLSLDRTKDRKGDPGRLRDLLLSVPGRPAADGRSLHRLFFNDTATTEIYTLSLHDALPI